MIKADRGKEIVKWHFPDDKEDHTIIHLRKVSGPKMAYMRFIKLNTFGKYEFEDWKTDRLTANIDKIENYENEHGKETTLSKPEEISKFVDNLSENETYLLLAAIDREGQSFDAGVIEKN